MNQLPSVLRLYVPVGPIWPHVLSQLGGTWFMYSEVISASIASEMLSAPDRPRLSSCSSVFMRVRMRFMRSISCSRTTFSADVSSSFASVSV